MKGIEHLYGIKVVVNKNIFFLHESNRVVYFFPNEYELHITPTMAHLLNVDFNYYFYCIREVYKFELNPFLLYQVPLDIIPAPYVSSKYDMPFFPNIKVSGKHLAYIPILTA